MTCIKEDESESEQSESLHMSSLSCVGGDLEIVQPGAKETLMQKFTRLHCEVLYSIRYIVQCKDNLSHWREKMVFSRQFVDKINPLKGCQQN